MTTIEYRPADGNSLYPLIIWPAGIRRNPWTAHVMLGWQFAWTGTGNADADTVVSGFSACLFL